MFNLRAVCLETWDLVLGYSQYTGKINLKLDCRQKAGYSGVAVPSQQARLFCRRSGTTRCTSTRVQTLRICRWTKWDHVPSRYLSVSPGPVVLSDGVLVAGPVTANQAPSSTTFILFYYSRYGTVGSIAHPVFFSPANPCVSTRLRFVRSNYSRPPISASEDMAPRSEQSQLKRPHVRRLVTELHLWRREILAIHW